MVFPPRFFVSCTKKNQSVLSCFDNFERWKFRFSFFAVFMSSMSSMSSYFLKPNFWRKMTVWQVQIVQKWVRHRSSSNSWRAPPSWVAVPCHSSVCTATRRHVGDLFWVNGIPTNVGKPPIWEQEACHLKKWWWLGDGLLWKFVHRIFSSGSNYWVYPLLKRVKTTDVFWWIRAKHVKLAKSRRAGSFLSEPVFFKNKSWIFQFYYAGGLTSAPARWWRFW